MENIIREMLKLFAYNSYKDDGTYILPILRRKSQLPNVNKDEVENKLNEISAQIQIPDGLSPEEKFERIFKEVFFDDKGYFIPIFFCYINAKPEHQTPNDFTINPNTQEKIPVYNFDKDIHFNSFLSALKQNFKDLPAFIKKTKSKIGDNVDEMIDYLNTDGKGLEILSNSVFKKTK